MINTLWGTLLLPIINLENTCRIHHLNMYLGLCITHNDWYICPYRGKKHYMYIFIKEILQ